MTTVNNKKCYPSEKYLNELITNIEFAARAPVEVVRAMAAELQKRREADSAEPVSQTYKLNELSGNSPVTPDGWISCSERMPSEEDVLVYCSDTKEQMVGFHKGKGLFQFFYMNGVEGVCEPSHWMPLPEPPL